MNGLRFKAGDAAIFAVPLGPKGAAHIGMDVQILEVGPFPAGHIHPSTGLLAIPGRYDYQGRCNGHVGAVYDWQLRKIGQITEPTSLTRESEQECEA